MPNPRSDYSNIFDRTPLKNTDSAGNKGYDAGKKVLPAIHLTTANVTDRAAPATPGSPLLGCEAYATNCTPSWCCRRDGWWSGLSPGWRSAAGSGRTANESSIPACKWWFSPSQR